MWVLDLGIRHQQSSPAGPTNLCPVAGARHLAGVLASWGPGSVLFESAKLLANAIPLFADRRLRGIEVDAEHNRRTAERSLRLSTVVGVVPGYDATLPAGGPPPVQAQIRAAAVVGGVRRTTHPLL